MSPDGHGTPLPAECVPPLDAWIRKRERLLVVVLCLLAGLRVWVFTAAFPFFSNIDESDHFDVITKYARGQIPEMGDRFGEESAYLVARFASPEYYHYASKYVDGKFPLPWWRDASEIPGRQKLIGAMRIQKSGEAMQPPLYYFTAGCWYRAGKAMGLREGRLLYWTRFLSAPVYALLVWMAWAMVRRFYPDRLFLRIGMAMMLVVFPQDVFYQLSNDVFSTLLGGGGVWLLLELHFAERPKRALGLLTGLVLAGAILVKLTNMLLLPLAAVVLVAKLPSIHQRGAWRANLPALALLAVAFLVPLAAWMIPNYIACGDWTNAAPKLQLLRLRACTWDEILRHPILTPGGAMYFWDELLRTFWRGETGWMLEPVAWAPADWFYSTTSFLLPVAALAGLAAGWRRIPGAERFSTGMMFLVFATSILLIAWLSVRMISVPFPGHGFLAHPSPQHPYISAGRLIAGALIPFLVLYLQGLDWLLSRWKGIGVRLACVGFIQLLVLGSEIAISLGVFRSQYNWFHLP